MQKRLGHNVNDVFVWFESRSLLMKDTRITDQIRQWYVCQIVSYLLGLLRKVRCVLRRFSLDEKENKKETSVVFRSLFFLSGRETVAEMKEITLIRSNVNEFWGFRLEDRKQENQPLVIRQVEFEDFFETEKIEKSSEIYFQVVSNSSADGKLNDGDILLKIFDKNAENLSFAEAISLIRRTPQCLNLTVRR